MTLRAFLSPLLVVALMLTTFVPMTIPPNAVIVEASGVGCSQPFYPEILIVGYNTDGDPNFVKLRIFFLIRRDEVPIPVVWLYYDGAPNGDRSRQVGSVYLTLPGKPAEKISFEELKRRFSTPCQLWFAVFQTRT